MDLAKYRFRFKQFGGLKLVKAFVKVGAFPAHPTNPVE